MIPSILWQTARSKKDLTKLHRLFIEGWKSLHPNLSVRFMDDNDCEKFIKLNFDQNIYNFYVNLPLGIMRSDFWRLAVVYIHGGIYCDIDTQCLNPIDNLLNRDLLLLEEPTNIGRTSNFLFAAIPKNPIIKYALDEMLQKNSEIFLPAEGLSVQDFGMAPLHLSAEKFNCKLQKHSKYSAYIKHHCHGSWRKTEKDYNDKMKDKSMIFFTTFNKAGYNLYGKLWIKSFKKYVASSNPNITAQIYVHGFKLTDTHPQIKILDFDKQIPDHKEWVKKYISKNHHSSYISKMTVRFSHKAFVIQKVLSSVNNDYAIWVDGDCVFHEASYEDFPKTVLKNNAIACQVEHAEPKHVESGIIVFNTSNNNMKLWLDKFIINYKVDNILNMEQPYDGFIVYKSLIDSNIQYTNLNEKYGMGGIQSDPSFTFLNPELKKRFTHNIGLTGKQKYKNWDEIKYEDQVYRSIASVGVLTETQKKINRMKRAKLRKKELRP